MAAVDLPTSNPDTRRGRMSRLAVLAFFAIWVAGSVAIGSSLMAGHWYTLPRPSTGDPILVRTLSELRDDLCGSERERWLAVHVLYSECRCSQRILDHLVEDERPAGIAEAILLIGENAELERRLAAAGFAIVVVTPAQLKARYRIESAPLLLVVAPGGAVRYCGGYTDRKQGLRISDREIMESLVCGGTADELPVFGCGVSSELQALLDPIGLRYQ